MDWQASLPDLFRERYRGVTMIKSLVFRVGAMLLVWQSSSIDSLVFLSDIPTPSLVLDVQAIQREIGSATTPIPPLKLPRSDRNLYAQVEEYEPSPHKFDNNLTPVNIFNDSLRDLGNASGDVCFGYIHSQVLRSHECRGNDELFLVELDVPKQTKAHMVLGLNNHHVVSYFWARLGVQHGFYRVQFKRWQAVRMGQVLATGRSSPAAS
jgi:hypothetical protein